MHAFKLFKILNYPNSLQTWPPKLQPLNYFSFQPVLHNWCNKDRGMCYPGKIVRSWCDRSSDQSFMVDPLSYFLFQPVPHDWYKKGHGMCYPVCGMMHIKEPLLLIGKSSPCGGSGFPLSLFVWLFFSSVCTTVFL